MTCCDVQRLLYDFLDGVLDNASIEAMQRHLGSCQHCRAAVEGARSTEERLRATFRNDPVPATLWPRIYADLDRCVSPAATTEQRRRAFT